VKEIPDNVFVGRPETQIVPSYSLGGVNVLHRLTHGSLDRYECALKRHLNQRIICIYHIISEIYSAPITQ